MNKKFLIAASAFISVSKIQFSSSIIDWLASSVFAVYLLSESVFCICIFTTWFEGKPFDLLTFLVGTIVIYLILTFIDEMRKSMFVFITNILTGNYRLGVNANLIPTYSYYLVIKMY